jgi:hypothetical protein
MSALNTRDTLRQRIGPNRAFAILLQNVGVHSRRIWISGSDRLAATADCDVDTRISQLLHADISNFQSIEGMLGFLRLITTRQEELCGLASCRIVGTTGLLESGWQNAAGTESYIPRCPRGTWAP